MKRVLAIIIAVLGIAGMLSGCGSHISLNTAALNTSKMKSYAYDISLDGSDSGNTDNNINLSLKGKAENSVDRIKTGCDFKIVSQKANLTDTVFLDASKKDFDFDLFMGVPDSIKSSANGMLDNVKNFYLSGKDLDSYLKKSMTDEEYQKFKSSFQSNNSAQVSKIYSDIGKVLSNSKELSKNEKFEEISGKDSAKNGKYTVKLSKADIKSIIDSYLGNEAYFKDLQTVVSESSHVYKNSDTGDLFSGSSKDAVSKFDKAIGTVSDLTVSVTIKIENSFITNVDCSISSTQDSDIADFDLKLAYSDINKPVSINEPSKTDKSTLDLVNMFNQLSSY